MPQNCQSCKHHLGLNPLLSEALADVVPHYLFPALQERICEIKGCIQPE